MKTQIKLNNETALDLPKLIAGKMLLQAGSGGGKSYAIRRILEQSFGQIPHIILDTEGEFSSLREKYDYILIGKGYDIAADPKTAALMALRLWEERVSAIIDLYELDPEDRVKFVDAFLNAMINAPKRLWKPVLLVIDEAHEYAPETEKSGYSIGMHRIASKGRKRHIAAIFATQSIASLSKRIVASCKNKLIGYASEANDVKRAAFELGMTPQEGLKLRDLDPGEFYAFGPAISKKIIQLKIGTVKTTHEQALSGAAKVAPASAKVKKALAKLADLPQDAVEEANTIAALKKQIVELKRAPKTENVDIKKISNKAFALGVESMKVKMKEQEKAWSEKLGHAVKEMTAYGKKLYDIHLLTKGHDALPSITGPRYIEIKKDAFKDMKFEVNVVPQKEDPQRDRQAAQMIKDGFETTYTGDLPQGEKAVLTALAQYEDDGLPRESVTTITGYKRSTRDAYIKRLQDKGFVRAALGKIFATREGIAALGPNFKPLPTGQALREHLMQKLPEGERKVLSVVLGEYLEKGVGKNYYITRDYISTETGYKRSTRDAYIARLVARQLVETNTDGVRPVDKLVEDL